MPHHLLAAALLPIALAAQSAPSPPLATAVPYDSGYVDHHGNAPAVVANFTASQPAAVWLRVEFGSCHLPDGSRLRLVSLRDGAVQWFDARSLAEYGHGSAYFNGDAVRIELVAAPGSANNRLIVTAVLHGDGASTDVGICGPTDQRVLSNDPRVGRLGGCCTMFLLNEFVLATAGHCLGGTGGIVSFNVPLSDPAGNPQYPPPSDQYAFRAGSWAGEANGLGSDWAVVAAVRNSNTGLYPGQAQGSWFLWEPPLAIGVQYVTVTGYGVHANPTWSLAQKTHSGPRSGGSTSLMTFAVSVTGCNSGSPVIEMATGRAWGITTHAGCTAAGGQNYGTGFGNQQLATAAAILSQSQVAGSLARFGSGCAGGFGTPSLALSGIPDVGNTVTIGVAGHYPNAPQFGVLLLGLSASSWAGGALPADLSAHGMPGCSLFVRPDVSVWLPTSGGAASYPQVLPNDPALVGLSIYCQHFAADPSAANAALAVATDAGRIHVGN